MLNIKYAPRGSHYLLLLSMHARGAFDASASQGGSHLALSAQTLFARNAPRRPKHGLSEKAGASMMKPMFAMLP
jgi:hypothetical protein